MVHVEQRALCAFEQQIGTLVMGFVEFARHVGHHRRQQFGVAHGFVIDSVEQHLSAGHVGLKRGAKVEVGRTQVRREHVVVQAQQLAQFVSKTLGVFQVLNAQCTAGNFVFIGRTNATAGSADLGIAAFFTGSFTRHIQRRMKRQDQRAGLRDTQARANFHASFFQAFDLFKQLGGRHHHAVADVALHARTHDAAGDQMQRGFHPIDHQGVPGIVTPLKTDHALRALRQPVHQLAFALVPPLGAYDNNVTTFGCIHFRCFKIA